MNRLQQPKSSTKCTQTIPHTHHRIMLPIMLTSVSVWIPSPLDGYGYKCRLPACDGDKCCQGIQAPRHCSRKYALSWQNGVQTFPKKGGANKPQIRAKNKDWPFSFSISSDYLLLLRLLSISIPRFVNQWTLSFPSISTSFKHVKFKRKALWQKWTIHHKSDIQLV